MWFLVASSRAATLAVPADFASIAGAVAAASPGDTVRLGPGTWVESVEVQLDLTFDAEPGATWMPAGESAIAAEGAAVVVRGIRFEGGGGRAIAAHGGSLTVERATFSGCSAEDAGGALRVDEGGSLVVRDSVFEGGSAGIGGHVSFDGAWLWIERSTFSGGVAATDGGSIAAWGGEQTLVGVTFHDNSSGNIGGAAVLSGGSVEVRQTLFCDNATVWDGGALYADEASLSMTGTVFARNSAYEGGGLYMHVGSLAEDNVTYAGNATDQEGMAVFDDVGGVHRDVLFVDHHGESCHALWDGLFAAVDQFPLFWDIEPWSTNTDPIEPVFADPLMSAWPNSGCDPEDYRPLAGSPAIDGGVPDLADADGTRADIGAFGGAYPLLWDGDGDGAWSREDCDDADAGVAPGAAEHVADGVDQDCDGGDACFLDADLDGRGESTVAASVDVDCADPGEAAIADDVCPSGDDADDPDHDGVPSACDPCPLDAAGDSDHDGVCDSDDVCPGFDDALDTDGDGIPNGCDTCATGPDGDGDGTPDDCDLCPGGDDRVDPDGDHAPSACDPCPEDPLDACGVTTPPGGDRDGDSVLDAVDPDPDDPGGAWAPPPSAPTGCATSPAGGAAWLLVAWVARRRR